MKRSGSLSRTNGLKRSTPLRRTEFTPKRTNEQAGWRKAVQEVIERSGNRCELRVPGVCIGIGQETDHILNRSQGGKADPALLQRACTPCHKWKGEHPGFAFENGLAIHNWERDRTGLADVLRKRKMDKTN